LELELIASRDQFKQYAQAKLSNIVKRDKYNLALKAMETSNSKVYQTLGKAFILRTKDELVGDYNELLKDNQKEHDEISVRIFD
jgi:hypothetical protein